MGENHRPVQRPRCQHLEGPAIGEANVSSVHVRTVPQLRAESLGQPRVM